jgi:hypothetical protein
MPLLEGPPGPFPSVHGHAIIDGHTVPPATRGPSLHAPRTPLLDARRLRDAFRDRRPGRGGPVDRLGGDTEPDHDHQPGWLVPEGRPRLPASIRGAGVDARRRRPGRQRRRPALAAARLGRRARADPDRIEELDRHQSRRLPRRPDAGRHLRDDLEGPRRGQQGSAGHGRPGELGPRLVARRPSARLLGRPGARPGPLLDRGRRRCGAPAHDQPPRRRRPSVFARRPMDLLPHPTAPARATSGESPPPAPARATARPSRSRATIARTRPPTPRPTASG